MGSHQKSPSAHCAGGHRLVRICRFVTPWLWLSIVASTLSAQQQSPPTSITATALDTGRIQRGDRDFSRYDIGMCQNAVRRTLAASWRTVEHDTIAYHVAMAQPLPDSILMLGRACAARLIEAQRNATDSLTDPTLWTYVKLSLMLGRDSNARTILEKQLRYAPSPLAQANAVLTMVQIALDATPVHTTLAKTLLARLDSLASDSSLAIARWQGKTLLLHHWLRSGNVAEVRASLDALHTLSDSIPLSIRASVANRIAGVNLLRLQFAVHDAGAESRSVHAIMERVQRDAPQLAALIATTLQLYGQPFVLPDSTYWYPAASTQPDKPARDMLDAGRITLVVPVNHNCGETCYPQYAALRRIHDRYASQGFDIVLMDNTAGYSPGSGVQTPDQEAAAARHYFFDFLKLPASALAVEVTPFTRRQDSIRVNGLTEFDERYATRTPLGPIRPAALLVGPDGTIRWIALIGTQWDGSIETLVDLSARPLMALSR